MSVAHNYIVIMLAIVILLLVGGYIYANETFAYAALLGSLIGALILALSFSDIHKAIAVGFAFSILSAIAVILATLVNEFIFPDSNKSTVSPQFAYIYHQLNQLFINKDSISLQKIIATKPFLISCKRYLTTRRYQLLLALLENCQLHYHSILTFNDSHRRLMHNANYAIVKDKIEAIINQLQTELKTAEHHVSDLSSYPPQQHQAQTAIKELETEIAYYRQHHKNQPDFIRDRASLLDLLTLLDTAKQIASAIQQDLALIHSFQVDASQKIKQKDKNKKTFKLNNLAIKRAFKYTLTVVVMLILHNTFAWHGGIQAIITSVVIVAQPNMGKSKQRLWQRFLGIICGGIIGLFFFNFAITIRFILLIHC